MGSSEGAADVWSLVFPSFGGTSRDFVLRKTNKYKKLRRGFSGFLFTRARFLFLPDGVPKNGLALTKKKGEEKLKWIYRKIEREIDGVGVAAMG